MVLGLSPLETHFSSAPNDISGACNLINQQDPVDFNTARVNQWGDNTSLFEVDGNWTPRADSLLLDACIAPLNVAQYDLWGNDRTVGMTPGGTFTVLDIGAVERQDSAIFANGFEVPVSVL